MKRRFIFALVLISAVGLIVHCGGSGNGGPDLAGTWEGTGWVDTQALGIGVPMARLAAEPLGPPCPSVDELVTVELELDSDGNPADLLICGQSIESILETSVSAEVEQTNFKHNVVWVLFTTTATGEDLYGGALVLDDSVDYATLFLWNSSTDEDLFLGVVQRTTGVLTYSEAAMVGVWSGITVDFWEDKDGINFEKLSPLDATLAQGGSLFMSGTDPDGVPFSGVVNMEDSDYGYVEGTLTVIPEPMGVQPLEPIGIDLALEGFVSLDGEFFGASVEEIEGPSNEWSIVNLRKEEILE